jgi:hypothetical protein
MQSCKGWHLFEEAATAFESTSRPWDIYRQVEIHFKNLFCTIGDTLSSAEVGLLWDELRTALHQDRLLLGSTEARSNLDAITISTGIYDDLPGDHELRLMSDADVSIRLLSEIDKIREAAGVFQAYAIELRARD